MSFFDDVSKSPLGKSSDGPLSYSADILVSIARQRVAADLGLHCVGNDIWTAYEFYYLNEASIPQIRQLQLIVDAQSSHIVESKSLKLYLNTYYKLQFDSDDACIKQIKQDLEGCIGSSVELSLITYSTSTHIQIPDHFSCLEREITELTKEDVLVGGKHVRETLYTDAFRSLCPVTSQPDFATVIIDYEGPAINKQSLLSYLLSFADHQGFHELCVEEIYAYLYQLADFESLTVQGLFTRRGGIDINPFRSNGENTSLFFRHLRQ